MSRWVEYLRSINASPPLPAELPSPRATRQAGSNHHTPMADDVVDLISDDEVCLSPAPSSPSPSPANGSPAKRGRGPAAVPLRIAAIFDDDSDSEFPSSRPPTASSHPSQQAADAQPIQGDSSDESDAEINALVEQARAASTAAANKPRPTQPHVLTPSAQPAARSANRVEAPLVEDDGTATRVDADDGDANKENVDVGISEAFLDRSNSAYIMPSMCDGPPPRPDDGPVLNRKEMLELVTLNRLSSDATAELPTPTEMNVVLLKHQRQALAWMCDRERDGMPPGHPRGGILADDQGFGKTLSIISLMLTNKPAMVEGAMTSPAWGNLVICPTSIIYQWATELESRIDAPYKPRVLLYHGHNRPRDPYVLVKYDVVITTYGTVRQEHPKAIAWDDRNKPIKRRRKGPLYKLKWFRVILDEAQAIKNHRCETFDACTLLQADRRWSLTGTPIQNTLDDIYSQFLFIRYFLVSSYTEWRKRYKKPLETSLGGAQTALFKRFQAKLGVVLLRRAKSDKIDGKPVISLPKRTVVVKELDFSPIERAYYQAQEERAVADLIKFGIDLTFASALVILLRLRQACSHPALCDWHGDRQFDFSDHELDCVEERMKTRCLFKHLPPETQARLSVELGPGTEVAQTCPICIEEIEDDGIVTRCGHIFCTSDFEEWNRENETCPTCRSEISGENDKLSLHEVREEIHALNRVRERREQQGTLARKVKEEPKVKQVKVEIRIGEKRGSDSSSSESPRKRRCRAKSEVSPTVPTDSLQGEDRKSDAVKENDANIQDHQARKAVSSTKIMAFMSEYRNILNTTEDKVLCYSQWTRMLDLVQEQIDEEGFEYVRLDGTMSPDERAAVIRMFNTRSKCRLFLISLQAGSTGLNLTVANRIFLLDSWWNPAVEDQAIDRVHRIGQTKDVEVIRFKIKDSVENKILELQEKKRMLIEGALGVEGLKTVGRRRLTFREVMGLFSDVANNVAARAGEAQNSEMQGMAQDLQMMALNTDAW